MEADTCLGGGKIVQAARGQKTATCPYCEQEVALKKHSVTKWLTGHLATPKAS